MQLAGFPLTLLAIEELLGQRVPRLLGVLDRLLGLLALAGSFFGRVGVGETGLGGPLRGLCGLSQALRRLLLLLGGVAGALLGELFLGTVLGLTGFLQALGGLVEGLGGLVLAALACLLGLLAELLEGLLGALGEVPLALLCLIALLRLLAGVLIGLLLLLLSELGDLVGGLLALLLLILDLLLQVLKGSYLAADALDVAGRFEIVGADIQAGAEGSLGRVQSLDPCIDRRRPAGRRWARGGLGVQRMAQVESRGPAHGGVGSEAVGLAEPLGGAAMVARFEQGTAGVGGGDGPEGGIRRAVGGVGQRGEGGLRFARIKPGGGLLDGGAGHGRGKGKSGRSPGGSGNCRGGRHRREHGGQQQRGRHGRLLRSGMNASRVKSAKARASGM